MFSKLIFPFLMIINTFLKHYKFIQPEFDKNTLFLLCGFISHLNIPKKMINENIMLVFIRNIVEIFFYKIAIFTLLVF